MTPVLRMLSRVCAPASEDARAAAAAASRTRRALNGGLVMRGMIHPAHGAANWTLGLCPAITRRAHNRCMRLLRCFPALLLALAACAAPEPWQKDGATTE